MSYRLTELLRSVSRVNGGRPGCFDGEWDRGDEFRESVRHLKDRRA